MSHYRPCSKQRPKSSLALTCMQSQAFVSGKMIYERDLEDLHQLGYKIWYCEKDQINNELGKLKINLLFSLKIQAGRETLLNCMVLRSPSSFIMLLILGLHVSGFQLLIKRKGPKENTHLVFKDMVGKSHTSFMLTSHSSKRGHMHMFCKGSWDMQSLLWQPCS